MWRYVTYPAAMFASIEGIATATVLAWRHATWSMPDPGVVAWIYIILGVAALVYGVVVGDLAVGKAAERSEGREKRAREKEAQARVDREKYMEKFGVAPDPEVVAPIKQQERSNG